MDQDITLTLKVTQVNIILNALGKGSYIEVADIISNIQQQARPQIEYSMMQRNAVNEQSNASEAAA